MADKKVALKVGMLVVVKAQQVAVEKVVQMVDMMVGLSVE